MVSFTGPAVVEDGRIVNVTFYTCNRVANPTQRLNSDRVPPLVTSVGNVVEKVYPAGTRVVVLDGANITAKIGSGFGRCWSPAKKQCVGKVFVVRGVDSDGDMRFVGDAGGYWSPDFVRAATTGEGADRQLAAGDSVVCDKPFTKGRTCHWLPSMDGLVGEVGQVISVDVADSEAEVKFGERTLTFPLSSLCRLSQQDMSARRMLDAVLGAFPPETSGDAIAALVKSTLGKRARKN